MLVFVLIASVHALSLRGLHDKLLHLEEPASNSTKPKAVNWDSFVGDYCDAYCQMKGVDAGRCTVCSQRMNFSVSEGKVSCDVECQGIQTDEVTESVVDCGERLDKCMFESVEQAECRLECGVQHASAGCSKQCAEFKVAARADGHRIKTFYGRNWVETTTEANVTKEVNGTNVTVVEDVTNRSVVGVEPLPTVGPGGIEKTEAAEFRFHVNESAWRKHAVGYCDTYYCSESGVDSWHCVECVNRLNNSLEHSMMTCRVGCDMHHTDQAKANELVAKDVRCDQMCMTTEFETATCRLECELHPEGPSCVNACQEHKIKQRADGKTAGPTSDVTPFFFKEPVANATNATAPKEEAKAEKA